MHPVFDSLTPRIRTFIGGAVLALLLIPPTGAAFAADATLLSVDPLTSTSVSGAVTYHGLAVDCTTAQPATRVSVYDGQDSSGAYIADVSMDTVRAVPGSCSNAVSANARTGFTLIFDSNKLTNGTHSLAFVASFGAAPNATTTTTTTQITVYNGPVLNTSYVNNTPYGASYVTPLGTVVNGNVYPSVVSPYGTVINGRSYYSAAYANPYVAPYQYVNGAPVYSYPYGYTSPTVISPLSYTYPYNTYPYTNIYGGYYGAGYYGNGYYGGCRQLINGVYYMTGSVIC